MATPFKIGVIVAVFVLGMIAPPIHAQTCNAPPLFDSSGPVCSGTRQGVECGCSECMEWDAATGATWYELRRCDHSGQNCVIVGDTRWRNRPASTDSSGVYHPPIRPTLWCAAWDQPFPAPGGSYDYTVRACKDGPSGPLCSVALSNAVNYVAAPYMCINNGLEVPCATTVVSSLPTATDLDGDGITDAFDSDDDGDGVPDAKDNCTRTFNPGQRDADRDGIGDACDSQPLNPNSGQADTDRDGIPDKLDNCAAVRNPQQEDTDHDRTGDACDNCPSAFNEMQADLDDNGVGDACDVNDRAIYARWDTRAKLGWSLEAGFTTWCVYRGDLAELRRSGTYTQAPGSNSMAMRYCGLSTNTVNDDANPTAGKAAFYLVAGRPGPSYAELGVDGAGLVRPNANPCP